MGPERQHTRPLQSDQVGKTFDEYHRLAGASKYYDAIAELAYFAQKLGRLPPSGRDEWARRLASIDLPPEAAAQMKKKASDVVERLDRIMSFGEKWNGDEVLFVLTLRHTLEIVERFLQERFHFGLEVDTADVDEAIHRRFRKIPMQGICRRLFASLQQSYVRRV